MANLLIRDVPDNVARTLDTTAGQLGLSRSEYVRRVLAREVTRHGDPVTVEDLSRFAETFTDLADPEVMRQAWQ